LLLMLTAEGVRTGGLALQLFVVVATSPAADSSSCNAHELTVEFRPIGDASNDTC
jgi:hypothetical protein